MRLSTYIYCVTLAFCVLACAPENMDTSDTHTHTSQLVPVDPLSPDDPDHPCRSGTPSCLMFCDTSVLDPGVRGSCCVDMNLTTCKEANLYRPGDKDGDLIPDNVDNCPNHSNALQRNSDSDPRGDACDNCPDDTDPTYRDIDGDGDGDVCDDDIDGDLVPNASDNCDIRPNPGQENSDDDSWGDACDNCPHEENEDQRNSDLDSRGDACDWDGYRRTLNSEAMHIGVPTCDGYHIIDNCINAYAPLPPSISRGISTASDRSQYQTPGNFTHPIDDKAVTLEHTTLALSPPRAGEVQLVPSTRTSNDGRLFTIGAENFAIYRPELAEAQGMSSGQDRAMFAHPGGFPRSILFGNVPDNDRPTSHQQHICDISGSNDAVGRELSNAPNPRPCQVGEDAASMRDADCYDITYMTKASSPVSGTNWGLYSVDVTVAVERAKSPDAHLVSRRTWTLSTQVYPKGQDNLITWAAQDIDAFTRSKAEVLYTTNDCACQDTSCATPIPKDFFEMTTTSDGLLMVANIADVGVQYAIAPESQACQAAGFELFKALSCLPIDARASAYDLSTSAPIDHRTGLRTFRNTKGEFIPHGSPMMGAYMWLDRKGKNLFWADVTDYRDGWFARAQSPAPDHGRGHFNNYPDQHENASGNGVVALGAWTQGKMVVIDGVINPTDWTGGITYGQLPTGEELLSIFEMALYQNDPMRIRPQTSAHFNSSENQLNYFASHSPTLPFDVVWRFGTNTNHNAEIVFDEYLINNAFVVAHMNAPHTHFSPGAHPNFPDDGFVPTYPSRSMRFSEHAGELPEFKFQRNPRIQNAATSLPSRAVFQSMPPSTLRLRGGARVEPVALGGVRGKGVYFDGHNDHMDMGFQAPQHDDWFYSVWADSRRNFGVNHTLFYWADGSWVGFDGGRLHAYDGANDTYKFLQIPTLDYIYPGEFAHIGLRSSHINGNRMLELYLNGEPKGTLHFANSCGFSMNHTNSDGYTWFAVGDPGPSFASPGYGYFRKPFKGWLDEFRIYALEPQSSDYFDEFICNLAMGSLKNQDGQEVCEQLSLHPQGRPVDIGPQKDLECADKVHDAHHHANCLRTQKLGISNLLLTSEDPRPKFDETEFCLTCHMNGHDMIELDVENALVVTPDTRSDDPRRQPMDWPADIYGQFPYGSQTAPGPISWSMDYWIHTGSKL